MDNSYIAQRLASINGGASQDVTDRIKSLEAENTKLREQLNQSPQAEFKSDVQQAFENSPEFEGLLNLFYMRYIRDTFGAEFRSSPHFKAFQAGANVAFTEFENNLKKENDKNGQGGNSKKAVGAGNAGVK